MEKITEIDLAKPQKSYRKVIIRKDGSKSVQTMNYEPSKSDQQYKTDTDVNYILRKFSKTGQLDHVSQIQGQYADVSQVPDLSEALMQVKNAEHEFLQLPAIVRKRFANSPTNLMEFLDDQSNNEEAIKLGLKVGRKQPDPIVPKEVLNEQIPKTNGDSKNTTDTKSSTPSN